MLLDTPLCDFGWEAPNFTLSDPYGQTFTLSEQATEKGILVMFICNHCPYVKTIAERLAADTQILLKEGFVVAAIMSNDYKSVPADSPDNMKTFAKDNHFSFPYLVDEDQSVGKNYNAICTPDFFGFNAQAQLQYRGRLDNLGMGSSTEKREAELLNAMQLIAKSGNGPREQTPSMGCSIKWTHV